MNKIIISLIAVLLPLFAFAQSQTGSTADSSQVTYGQPSTVKYFGEIVYTDISAPAKKTIQIDFGVNSIFGKRYPDFKDENGKTVRFTTVVDALNYMSSRGWVLELEYEIYNLTKDELCTVAQSRHCFLHDDRLVSLKKELPKLDTDLREQMEIS